MLRTPDWLCALALLAEPVAALGTPEQVEQLIAALAPHAGRNAVMDDAWAAFGPVARPLGVLAAAAGRRDEAVAQLERGGGARRRAGTRRAGSSPRSPTCCASRRRRATRVRDRALALARTLELPGLATEIGAASG